MEKIINLQALNSKKVSLAQFAQLDLTIEEYDELKGTIFVKVPTTDHVKIQKITRICQDISKLAKKTIVVLPDEVHFFQLSESDHKN